MPLKSKMHSSSTAAGRTDAIIALGHGYSWPSLKDSEVVTMATSVLLKRTSSLNRTVIPGSNTYEIGSDRKPPAHDHVQVSMPSYSPSLYVSDWKWVFEVNARPIDLLLTKERIVPQHQVKYSFCDWSGNTNVSNTTDQTFGDQQHHTHTHKPFSTIHRSAVFYINSTLPKEVRKDIKLNYQIRCNQIPLNAVFSLRAVKRQTRVIRIIREGGHRPPEIERASS